MTNASSSSEGSVFCDSSPVLTHATVMTTLRSRINNFDINYGAPSHEDPKRIHAPIDGGTIGANRHIIPDIHNPKVIDIYISIPRSK